MLERNGGSFSSRAPRFPNCEEETHRCKMRGRGNVRWECLLGKRPLLHSIHIGAATILGAQSFSRRLTVKISAVFLAALLGVSATAIAQAQATNSTDTIQVSTYRESVVSRTTRAVMYEHRSGSTKIDFRGTDLMPAADGIARVESKRGTMKIDAEFGGLDKPTAFGGEYLTYVLWAISPEGRPVNVGEVLVGSNHRSKLDVTTDLQAFAMIVTAEPYYAVRRPSNVVVLENEIRPDTVGTSEAVDAKYELIDRGGYIPTGYQFDPVVLNSKLPLEFFEARNAVRIAKSAGAEQNATTSYDNAVREMKQADALGTMKHVDKKALIAASREVVQTADDAREISVKRIDADRIAAQKNAAAGQIADADAKSRQARLAQMNAEAATADADRRRHDADQANAAAQQQALNAQAEADRSRAAAANANQATADANQATADANQNAANAQQGQRDAEADSAASKASAAAADQQLQQAVLDREALRAKLLQQFNAILITRDTARGLVVNLSDVLFDTGKYTLRPVAREKLAKISGIVLAYPDLKLAIEGNTDSVGSDEMNQTLSEKRASAVMDYLAAQNIPAASMTSRGLGKNQPIASNDTADGRQQNRRVEIVVSGDVIGTTIGPVSQIVILPTENRRQ
jgi:outer membrane protein OmpA-like peptidoglycan-associated protein